MSARNIVHSLHFKITSVFLLLLVAVFWGYTAWVDHSLYGVEWAPGEQEWYDIYRDAEMDSLAVLISDRVDDIDYIAVTLADYGRTIAGYDAEMAMFDAEGLVVATSDPDSLSHVLVRIQTALLDSMSLETWDFTSYPNPDDMDAYENRITAVVTLHADGDTLNAADGWLVSTFTPLEVDLEANTEDNRMRMIWGAAVILVYSFFVGLTLLTWVSRRVRSLSRDMATFRDGDFEHRAADSGADEIGRLGRDFNRLADRLTTVIAELRQSEEYRSQLVANISHDLRTPMATLRSYVESFMLRWDSLEAADRDRQLKTIASNLDNLEGLIERLFELTRLDNGNAEFRRESFSLEELAVDVLDRMEVKATEHGVTLDLSVEDGLPLVEADALRIVQVLQNLLDNAIKFNETGGSVWVTLRPVAVGVEVEVRDDGPGISDEDRTHVFERFYTADKSRSDKGRGSGLGLAIAHRIVTNHGGSLTLENADEDGGAIFRFTLPAADA